MRLDDLVDGIWYTPAPLKKVQRMRIACCDCGLIHDWEFRVRKGQVEWRVKRNGRATKAERVQYHGHSAVEMPHG